MLLKDVIGGALFRPRIPRPAGTPQPETFNPPWPDPMPAPKPGLSVAVGGLRSRGDGWAPPAHAAHAEHDIRAFIALYLRHHFPTPYCEMHHDIFDQCDKPDGGKRVARIAPRKFGKTTIIGLAVPLQKLAFKKKWFILMVGESLPSAQANLQSIIEELEKNEALRNDFPHLAPARDRKGQLTKWTDHQLVFESGATILAKGMGSKMRGVKFRNHRPDLAILDDPESPETADTFHKRKKHLRWFGGTFIGLGADDWDIYVIGNLPHEECLIAQLVMSEEWDGLLWRAINFRLPEEKYPLGNTSDDNSPLWPEGWPLEKLAALRRDPTVGDLNFFREMLNIARNEADIEFQSAEFTYIDWDTSRMKDYVEIWTTVDPAGGERPGEMRRGNRDYYCAVTGARCRDGWIEIFDLDLARKPPDAQMDSLVETVQKWDSRVLVEENMYKNLYGDTLSTKARNQGVALRVETVDNTVSKMVRILGSQPYIMDRASRRVRFARHLRKSHPEFFAQYDQFPADHDDGPDATSALIKKLYKASSVIGMTSLTRPSPWRGKA